MLNYAYGVLIARTQVQLIAEGYDPTIGSLRDYMKTYDASLSITAETSRCQWRGESMDYSMAIESMQFLESKAAVPELLGAPSAQ